MASLNINFSGFEFEAGVDEAGRGCLAGPVFAAAVILPMDFNHPFLNDSKQLTEKKRTELRPIIEENALSFSVAKILPKTVDEINILNASILCMHRALEKLEITPEFIIVDGNRFKPFKSIKYQTIIQGDAKFKSIAAASILAKTYRDDYMVQLDHKFPDYGWFKNKGYATKFHREAIRTFGPCEHHRKSFTLLNNQMRLEF